MRGYVNVPGVSYAEHKMHVNDHSNPHKVSARDVGLDKVPNVATNDQTPTYTQASTLANLTSGEKLSVSMGKIMKAIADLISHMGNRSNPHGVDAAAVGLGNVDNTSDADKPVSTAQATAISGAKQAGTDAKAAVETHIADKNNPHNLTAEQTGADPKGTAASAVSGHNTASSAHNDIRLLIDGLTTRLNALANSDDETLDQMSEVVAYIKANKALIDSITTDKVSVKDIIDNLESNVSNKPLSAAQGVALKNLIDNLNAASIGLGNVPNVSTNDQTPTYTQAATLTNLVSGEKLSVSFGKIMKAVADLISHLGNKNNPHAVTAAQVGARPNTWMPTAADVGADPKGTAASAISGHNTETTAHNDIRSLIDGLTTRLNALANSDDTTLDQMAEVVAYIKSNRTLIESVTTNKVNVTDIVNDLATNVANKPLSAAQGVALKDLITSLNAASVGLGNVPNVATNDQTPTYTQASTLANLTSGEKLSVSMGKIMKAIADLISHIGNKSNPHAVTASQVGASESSHLHSGQNITPASIDIVPGSGAGHGGYVDFRYGNASDYTTRLIETNGKLDIFNKGTILTSGNLTAVYSTPVKFSDGSCVYTNSAIKTTSVCIVQRTTGTPGAATTCMFGTKSGNGTLTIVTDNLDMTDANLNILIINP